MFVHLVHLSPLWGLLLRDQRFLYTFRLSEALANSILAPAVRKVYRKRITQRQSTSGAKGV